MINNFPFKTLRCVSNAALTRSSALCAIQMKIAWGDFLWVTMGVLILNVTAWDGQKDCIQTVKRWQQLYRFINYNRLYFYCQIAAPSSGSRCFCYLEFSLSDKIVQGCFSKMWQLIILKKKPGCSGWKSLCLCMHNRGWCECLCMGHKRKVNTVYSSLTVTPALVSSHSSYCQHRNSHSAKCCFSLKGESSFNLCHPKKLSHTFIILKMYVRQQSALKVMKLNVCLVLGRLNCELNRKGELLPPAHPLHAKLTLAR